MISMVLNDKKNFKKISTVFLCDLTPFLACWIVIASCQKQKIKFTL